MWYPAASVSIHTFSILMEPSFCNTGFHWCDYFKGSILNGSIKKTFIKKKKKQHASFWILDFKKETLDVYETLVKMQKQTWICSLIGDLHGHLEDLLLIFYKVLITCQHCQAVMASLTRELCLFRMVSPPRRSRTCSTETLWIVAKAP